MPAQIRIIKAATGFGAILTDDAGRALMEAAGRTEEIARDRLLLVAKNEETQLRLGAFILREQAEVTTRDAAHKEGKADAIRAAIEALP
jgi:hypothetical protein